MLRYSWHLACVAALIPQFAAAQTGSNNIARAAEARDKGDYRDAAMLLEAALRDRPRDPLVLRLLGSAYAYSGEYEQAVQALRQARSIAPTDQDIALMLARTYLWSGRNVAASKTARAIAIADPVNAELLELRNAIAEAATDRVTPPPQLVMSFTQALSDVKIGSVSKKWHQTVAGLTVPMGAGAALSAAIDRESRAGPVDTRIELRADMSFGTARYAYASATVTPDADFREYWGLRAGGEAGVAQTVNVTVDLRYADYGSTEIIAVEPGIRLHSLDDRLSLAIKSINLWSDDDRHRSGWSVRGEVQAKKTVRLTAGGASYPDTEAGITRRTRAAFVGAVVNLSDQVILRTFYEYERRAQSYTRNGVVLALSLRF